MKLYILILSLSFFISTLVFGQRAVIQSPNKKISAALFCQQATDIGEWYIKALYHDSGKTIEAIPQINLGLSRNDGDFSKDLKFLKAGKPSSINEEYLALHGKKSVCKNSANEVVVSYRQLTIANILNNKQ